MDSAMAYFKVVLKNFTVGSEENHDKICQRGQRARIQTCYHLNMKHMLTTVLGLNRK
jgi:hypothetical protein